MATASNPGLLSDFSAAARRSFRQGLHFETIRALAAQHLTLLQINLARRQGHNGSAFSFTGLVLAPAALTLVLVVLATATIFIFRDFLHSLNLVSIVYLLPVLMASVWWGIWPAILAAVAGALAADFFFYPPLYSFWISDTQNIADLIVFLIVALVSGNLAGSLRQREREIHDLYAYSKQLAACFTTADLIRATQNHLSKCLGHPTFLIAEQSADDDLPDEGGVPKNLRRDAVAMIIGDGLAPHTILDGVTRRAWLVRRVPLGPTDYVVFVDLGTGAAGAKLKLDRRIDAILTETAESLARFDLEKALDESRMQAQANELKNALVATMSHDLRTPLVSILGAASVLEQIRGIKEDERARALVGAVHGEAARLDSDIQNLVDAARITAGVGQPNRELTDPVDMVHAAVDQKSARLAAHRLEVSLESDLPLVRVQSALVENALAQLLDNAAKYSRAGSTIKLEGRAERDWVMLSVTDSGVGLTPDERQRIGQRSFRGTRHAATVPGSGLGLWIANTFITANGGRLDAESCGTGLGATVRISLPAVRDGKRWAR
jgi:two-component system, OmpR family, sensor histidine kinase KdpD